MYYGEWLPLISDGQERIPYQLLPSHGPDSLRRRRNNGVIEAQSGDASLISHPQMAQRSGVAALRNTRRNICRDEASARAETKTLTVGTGWAPFPGSGVHLAMLRRFQVKGRIELRREISEGRIKVEFRTVQE